MQPEIVHTQSLATLVKDILGDLRTLIREEIALARVEMKEQAGRARAAAVSLGIAAAALTLGGIFMLLALATGISYLFNWPEWAGFLAVAVLLGLIGFVTLSAGRKKLRTIQTVPEETVSTIKENSEWIARRLSSERR